MTLLYILALLPLPILLLIMTYSGAKQTAENDGVSIWTEYCVFFLIIIFVLILAVFVWLFIYSLAKLMKL